LRTLRTAAFDVADRKLPEAVEQLCSTEGVSAQPTVDPVPVHSREEVGQVARAFDTVHAQAVRLAAEQAVARSSLNDTFRNLSGRHQCLVERQRQLIGELRSREHDPELVSGLDQLDHLAARMCRHSDNVLVLAGGRLPPRGADPVAVFDVLHSAVSKIEQYQQVVVRRPPAVMVAGAAVNDLVHLIAELLDNAIKAGAASVASQETPVTLGSTRTEDGRLQVEIIDSGPGLPPDVLRSINDRLASPPVVDASVSRQMGLFVVSRLAAQHDIAVRLRRCLGQVGITAEVSVPSALVSIDTRASNDGATVVPDTTDWSETGGQLPLQVSVIDEATAADLFSPASIGIVTAQPSCPRTAEQSWFELFGSDECTPEREQAPDPLGGGTVASGFPAAPVMAAVASPLPLGRARVARQPPEIREEIFEMVSAWFREQQSANSHP
ncbi:MAG: sensor histidine kinase, partial [Actinomycetes bacterium]